MPCADRVEVLAVDVGHGHASVELQRPDGHDDDGDLGAQSAGPALDVDELLGPEVGAEPGLGDDPVAQLEGGPGGHHRVAAVGDVRERPAVDEGGRVLERLHQVRGEGVTQQHGHRALGLQVAGGDLLLGVGVADHDVAEPALEVGQRVGQADDRHHLGRHDDVEAVLAGHAVGHAAQAHDDLAQRPVVEVDHALPGDGARVDVQGVALVQVVVDHRGEQVVGRGDRGEVSGEGEVDVDHRHDLAVPATGRAALDAEHRAHRRLAQGHDALLADATQGVGQPDRGGGLALAGRRRAHRRDEHAGVRRVGPPANAGSSARPWPWCGRTGRGPRPGCRARRVPGRRRA